MTDWYNNQLSDEDIFREGMTVVGATMQVMRQVGREDGSSRIFPKSYDRMNLVKSFASFQTVSKF
jgi:hypothetical protein